MLRWLLIGKKPFKTLILVIPSSSAVSDTFLLNSFSLALWPPNCSVIRRKREINTTRH